MSSPPDAPRPETIGERLRRLRLERRMSQRELSAPGVSYAYISRIEAGTRQPSVKALRKLAAKLGVSPEYLETGEDVRPVDRREMELVDAELELRLGKDPQAAEQRLRRLLDDATAGGDVRSALRARIVLGTAAVESGRPAEAAELLEAAIDDGEVSPAEQPEVYAQLGHAYAALGHVRRAIDLYAQCLHDVDENDPENVAARVQFATHLSYALSDVGEFDRAQSVLDGVLESADALTDSYTQVKLYWSLARVSGLRGELGRALVNARRAIALLEATENTVQLGRARLLCGVILLTKGRPHEAGVQFELAESLLGLQPNPADLASLRTEQARREVVLGEGAAAVARAREALELLGDSDPGERGRALQALGEGLTLQGATDEASDAFRASVDALEQAERYADAAQACRAWGRMLRKAGREGEALDVLDRAADLGARRESLHFPTEA
ncbi:MAG TPA: helix-turn-helix transcriptional regulator [Gaiellaceae bacterium]|nr:helix-turn-helix transcriptional regulator [Gaiellaceae bacterium]